MSDVFPNHFFSPQSLDSDLSDGPISVQEFLEVKNALSASEAKIQELMKANSNLSEELRLMQKKVPEIQPWALKALVIAAFLLLNKARPSNPYTCTSSRTRGGKIDKDYDSKNPLECWCQNNTVITTVSVQITSMALTSKPLKKTYSIRDVKPKHTDGLAFECRWLFGMLTSLTTNLI